MKKALIITLCVALLICTFCIAAAAEDEWTDATEQNVSNLSYIIKMLKDAGYTVNEETPFESATGEITIGGDGIPANTTITTTMTIADLIEDFDAQKYYAVAFYAPGMTITIGTNTFTSELTQNSIDGIEPKQLNSANTVTITTTQTVTSINTFMVSEWSYEAYITGTATWVESTDYETGYIYASDGEGGLAGVMAAIITTLVGGLAAMATGIGGGLSALVKQIFTVVDPVTGAVAGLSTFGGVIIVFAGISLAVGISRFVVSWVTSLGGN